MSPFEYASPTRLEDAIALLADVWGETEILAGGTDLMTSLKQNIVSPKRVVSLKNIRELRRIEVSDKEIHVGATVSLAEFADHPDIRKHFPCLVQAVEGIASPQILTMGTVAGDLCQRPRCWYFRRGYGLLGQHNGKPLIPEGDNRYHAVFGNKGPAYFVNPSSLAPGLIALGAGLTLAGPGGKTRQRNVADFFRPPDDNNQREYDLKPNEIITRISIPVSSAAGATYEVRQRKGLDWPLVTASVTFENASAARNATVVLGHVAPTPWAVPQAGAVLEGKKIDAILAAKAGQVAAEGATPLSRNGYKIQLVRTAVKRAVLVAAGIEEG